MPLQCEIVTQERLVFSGGVESVSLPGTEGRMGILLHHSPMLTALGFGEVMIRTNGEEHYYAVGGGFAEIQPDKVVVLADSAEHAEEIDLDRAEKARVEAEQAMQKEMSHHDPMWYAQLEASLSRAKIRVDVSKRRSKRKRSMPGMHSYEE